MSASLTLNTTLHYTRLNIAHTEHYTLNTVHITMNTVHITLNTVHITPPSAHYKLHKNRLLILPWKFECPPIFQSSIQIFQFKILFLVLSFQKRIALVYLFKDGLKLYVFKGLKLKAKF